MKHVKSLNETYEQQSAKKRMRRMPDIMPVSM